MVRILFLGISLFSCFTGAAQQALPADTYADYAGLITAYKTQQWRSDSTVRLPVLYAPKRYPGVTVAYPEPVVRLNRESQQRQKRQILLAVPPGSHGYPVGPTLVFNDHLIALFSSGRFGCYRLADFSRNPMLEAQLNTRHWDYKWLIDGTVVAQAGRQQWQLAPDGNWHSYNQPLPMGLRPLLLDDQKYLVYGSCMGEFGGQVLFFDKAAGTTHVAAATCPAAVWPSATGGYAISTSLAHMAGSSELRYVANVQALPTFRQAGKKWEALPAQLPVPDTAHKVPGFSYVGVLLQKAGTWHGQPQYLFRAPGATVLAVPQGDTLLITDPLFQKSLPARGLTQTYGQHEIISFTDPTAWRASETAAILLQGSEVILLEWHKEKQKRNK
jgi:hypothetical protein